LQTLLPQHFILFYVDSKIIYFTYQVKYFNFRQSNARSQQQAGKQGLSIYGGAPPWLSAELTGYTAILL